MIAHLASSLVGRYTNDATHLLDPFCGSGAVLRAASLDGIPVTGIDVNPFGVLLSSVKLEGFNMMRAMCLTETLLDATNDNRELPVEWDSKEYWFTIATLRKFERLRYRAFEMDLGSSNAGCAVLLAFALSVRQCSRADQRSPKPFISKNARNSRKGQHFDPVVTISRLLNELGELYGRRRRDIEVQVLHKDISDSATKQFVRRCSHVITSPPTSMHKTIFVTRSLNRTFLKAYCRFVLMISSIGLSVLSVE